MNSFYDTLRRLGVLWIYEEGDPHALLASGKHSNGFLNLSILTTYPDELRFFARHLADDIATYEIDHNIEPIADRNIKTWVIGSAMGAVQLASWVAFRLSCYEETRAAYTEKSEDGMSLDRFISEVGAIDRVILTEDVMTTGSTTKKTIQALHDLGLNEKILPLIGVLVNRSGKKEVDFGDLGKYEIISVVDDIVFDVWDPEECPLCENGVELLKPKHHWNKFVKK